MSGILALDLATLCGWALYRGGELVGSGMWDLRPKRSEGRGARLIKLGTHLAALAPRPSIIIYELTIKHRSSRDAHAFGALLGKVQEYAEWAGGIPMGCLVPGQIKKHATGNGRAEKPMMVAAAEAHWSLECIDDNHADALCLLAAWIGGVRMKGSKL